LDTTPARPYVQGQYTDGSETVSYLRT